MPGMRLTTRSVSTSGVGSGSGVDADIGQSIGFDVFVVQQKAKLAVSQRVVGNTDWLFEVVSRIECWTSDDQSASTGPLEDVDKTLAGQFNLRDPYLRKVPKGGEVNLTEEMGQGIPFFCIRTHGRHHVGKTC